MPWVEEYKNPQENEALVKAGRTIENANKIFGAKIVENAIKRGRIIVRFGDKLVANGITIA